MEIKILTADEMTHSVASQLAKLFAEKAWPRGFYPYKILTTPEGWMDEAVLEISKGRMVSLVSINRGRVVGHAGLVFHGFWECGRWAVDPKFAGRGMGLALVSACTKYAQRASIPWFVVGCSYYQRFSEQICRSLGMRCLGINPRIYKRKGAIWGETLFLWNGVGNTILQGLRISRKSDKKTKTVGIWPYGNGLWKELVAEGLPDFELKKKIGKLKGDIPVHTTPETIDVMRSYGWSL